MQELVAPARKQGTWDQAFGRLVAVGSLTLFPVDGDAPPAVAAWAGANSTPADPGAASTTDGNADAAGDLSSMCVCL